MNNRRSADQIWRCANSKGEAIPNKVEAGLVFADFKLLTLCLLVFLLGPRCWSQEEFEDVRTASEEQTKPHSPEQLNVNWLYGAYVPKEAPLVSLTRHQREKLFVRQTFTTPGIYVRSSFLALMDQASGTPYQWGGGFEGYGRREASIYARSSIQNVFSTLGNAALQYEPRYDRCRCVGLGPRTKHALLRNLMTYDKTEEALRPQFALYGAALGAGMLSSIWKPQGKLWVDGYRGVVTQAGFGMLSNWIGEFAPEIRGKLKRQNHAEP